MRRAPRRPRKKICCAPRTRLDSNARPAIVKGVLELLVLMLSPMAPHLCEELWEMLGNSQGLDAAGWPEYAPELAAEEQVDIVVQINGRVRGKISVEAGLDENELARRAEADPKVKAALDGKKIVKRVVVPNRLVNLVIA
jgi:leucyl-tRNA synthetase